MKTTLKVEGLNATAENAHLEKAIEAIPGVESVEMDSGHKTILVEHQNVPEKELLTALQAAGYGEAQVVR